MINTTNTRRKQSFKVRKSGNSAIVTIPSFVREKLNINSGDSLVFVEMDGVITIQKEEPKVDIDKAMKKALNQYHDLLEELVDL